MAYTTIDDPSQYFQTVLYSGNGSTQSITNDGNSDLQPDFLWFKNRNDTQVHQLFDSSRGIANSLRSNGADTENTDSPNDRLTAINSDGFSLGDDGNPNNGSNTYVCWQWKANGGSRTTFTESSNNPGGGYQANTTAGFSIVDYVGTGGTGTVSHGLGAVPSWILFKNRDTAQTWVVYHHKNTSAPETDILQLESTNATYDGNTYFNDTAPTSSVFTVATSNDLNKDGDNIISYVWTEIQGFSKFGSYTGNNSSDGPFVHTGFKPAWVMIKVSSGNTGGWDIYDSKRGFNPNEEVLQANANSTEASSDAIDLLSNGFKVRNTTGNQNGSGNTHVYMAFAEHPFVSSKGVPCTAE